MGVMAVTARRVRRLSPTRRKVQHIITVAELVMARTSALVMNLLLILYVVLLFLRDSYVTRLLMVLLVCELHLHLMLRCSLSIVVIILITIGGDHIGCAPTAPTHLLKV